MHLVLITPVICSVALLCSAGPIAHPRLFLEKRQDEFEQESRPAFGTSTDASHGFQIISATSGGDDTLSIVAVTLSADQTGSSASPLLPHTAQASDPSETVSPVTSQATGLSSANVGASNWPTATGRSSKITATPYSGSVTSSKTAVTSQSSPLFPVASSGASSSSKPSSQAGASHTASVKPTVTSITTTSTLIPQHGSTAIFSGTQLHSTRSSGLFGGSSSPCTSCSSTRASSHSFSTAVASFINTHSSSSTLFSRRPTAEPTTAWSPVGQPSSHSFGSSTTAGSKGSTTLSSPTVGVIKTLLTASSSGTATGTYQDSGTAASYTSQTGSALPSGATANAHTSKATDLTASTLTASRSVTSSRLQTTMKISVTQSPFIGVPTDKDGPTTTSQGTPSPVTSPGIVVILPGSHTITIPYYPNDDHSKTVSPPTQALSTPATRPGEMTTVRPTSTTTRVITVELTTTAQSKPSVTTMATGSGSRAATQATGSKVPDPSSTSGPDTGGSLVVNPVSPVFFTKTETVTVTEKITETKTVAMTTVTATITVGSGA
ncbi:hypothetical protein BBP40_003757 [Aspergillus hancockii]|nr:hypothetical protein BBP40_003757 [Aspergillus hancockii]